MACMCGDSECPSCGSAQGTYSGDSDMATRRGEAAGGTVMKSPDQQRIDYLESALRKIAEKSGPYSKDPLEHADNCIENMARIAQGALDRTWDPEND
jgi:hypothetical protein